MNDLFCDCPSESSLSKTAKAVISDCLLSRIGWRPSQVKSALSLDVSSQVKLTWLVSFHGVIHCHQHNHIPSHAESYT